jgi:CHAT domain-containing protein
LWLADCQVFSPPTEDNPLQHLHLKDGAVLDLSECLTLADLFTKDLSACRLVTLSACETGLTDFTSLTDEYISLPSGFIYAGVPSVVSSLWRVDDLATALLMIKFYENLQRACREAMQSEVPEARVQHGEGASSQTLSVARALNTAQIWLRDATTLELQAWASHLKLSSELIQQIDKVLDCFNSDEQPFQDPMYWAAFCAIGQ